MADNLVNEQSFQDILRTIKIIYDENAKSLKSITTRKGEDVIIHRSLSVEQINPNLLTRKVPNLEHALGMIKGKEAKIIVEKQKVKSAIDLICSWQYSGLALEKEKIILGDFIDLKLKNFEDVERLHAKFDSIHEKYSRILNDIPIAREAAQILSRNVTKIQEAIREVHSLTIDVKPLLCSKHIHESS